LNVKVAANLMAKTSMFGITWEVTYALDTHDLPCRSQDCGGSLGSHRELLIIFVAKYLLSSTTVNNIAASDIVSLSIQCRNIIRNASRMLQEPVINMTWLSSHVKNWLFFPQHVLLNLRQFNL
jgi:hypothetical protein